MKSNYWKVAEILDFQVVEGIKCLLEEPRKVSQNIAIQWYKVVRKVVRLSNKHLKCNEW